MKHPIHLLLFAAAITTTLAEESGVGHYVPGSMGTLIDLPPTQPGWVTEGIYLHYNGSVSVTREIPVSSLITAGLDATSDAFILGGFYTMEKQIANSWFSFGAFIPYIWMDVKAEVILPGGPVFQRDRANGLGDITLLPAMMAWECNDWQYHLALPIYAPTGKYTAGRLANPGLNRWTFDPTFGVAYNGEKNGINAAFHTGFSINTENNDTDYKSGTVWHADLSAQQLLPLGPGFIGLGFNAFYYQQITGDSGAGATLGDFKGRTAGIGPVLTYILPVGDNTFVCEARWLPELSTKRRLEGDYFWLKVVYQF